MSYRGRALTFRPWKPEDKFAYVPIRTMDCQCWHCGRTTRHVLETVEDEETREWRERHDSLLGLMNQAVQEVTYLFGVDPLAAVFRDKMIKLRDSMGLKCRPDPEDEGEEWKRCSPLTPKPAS